MENIQGRSDISIAIFWCENIIQVLDTWLTKKQKLLSFLINTSQI